MVERRYITEMINRSLPAVLVVLLWAGLWRVWPVAQPYTWRPERKPFKVTFLPAAELPELAATPTVFALDSAISYQPERVSRAELLRMPGMPEGKQEFMPISMQVLQPRERGSLVDYSVWEKLTNDFFGAWDGGKVFSRAVKEDQLVVVLSDNLSVVGFTVPAFTADELKAFSPGWEVRVLVDIDKLGLPKHVLIEKGSGNKDIDSLICSKILVGRADKKEAKGGRVTVSYGSE